MATTDNLSITLVEQSQSQKEVTVNDAIVLLDALINTGVIDKDLTTPPVSPASGDLYIVASGSTGAWAGQDNNLALYNQTWRFITPNEGLTLWVNDEDSLYAWNGSTWVSFPQLLQNLSMLGINASADATNKLTVASSAILFNNIGNSVQVKLNKAAVGDSASFLYQTNWSGRAEFGTTGDDDFHIKVSPDGSTWYDALIIDKDTGDSTFKITNNLWIKGSAWQTVFNLASNGNFEQHGSGALYHDKYMGASSGNVTIERDIGKNSAAGNVIYGQRLTAIIDATAGSEDSQQIFYAMINGVVTPVMYVRDKVVIEANLEAQGLSFDGGVNILNQYEEGTFTPVLYGSSVAGSPVHLAQGGRYTRIGNRCFYSIRLQISSKGGLTGQVRISGMPFICAANSEDTAAANIGYINQYSITTDQTIYAAIQKAKSEIYFYANHLSGAISFLESNITDSFTVYLSGHYRI